MTNKNKNHSQQNSKKDCCNSFADKSPQETQAKGESPISLVSELDNSEYAKKGLSKHDPEDNIQKTPDTDLKKEQDIFNDGFAVGMQEAKIIAQKETAEKVQKLKEEVGAYDEIYSDVVFKIIDKIFKEAEGEKK